MQPLMQNQLQKPDSFGFYRDLMHPNNSLYNPGRKSQQIKEDAATRLAQMGITDPAEQKSFLSTGRKAYNQALGRKKAQKSQWTDIDRTEHLTHKNSVSNQFKDKVNQYVGIEYPDAAKSHMYNKWDGKYPQTLNDTEREEAGRMFAEMTGTLGWMPTYDKKLTAKESAAQVFNPNDYDIQAYDMDNNPLTPANVIIRKKNSDGTLGPILAANGYRLPNATPSQQLRRLKEIDYYQTHPTVDARKQQGYGAFLKEQKYLKESKSLMNEVKTFIKDVLTSFKEYTVKPPAFFSLITRTAPNRPPNNLITSVTFQFSTVAFNTLIARTARLFLLYQCYCHANPIPNANTAEAITFNNYIQFLHNVTVPPTRNQDVALDGRGEFFRVRLLEPHTELAMFRDSRIADTVRQCIATNKRIHEQELAASKQEAMGENKSSVYYRIRDLMSMVIMNTMRFGATAVAKMVGYNDARFLRNNAYIELVPGNQYANLRSAVMSGRVEPINVSVVSNAELVKLHVVTYYNPTSRLGPGATNSPVTFEVEPTNNLLEIDENVEKPTPVTDILDVDDDEWGNHQLLPSSSSSSSANAGH